MTTFHYGSAGTLQSVSVPNPTANDGSTVTYTYTYDSLGRPTRVRRPDGQTGVDFSYDGLTHTSREVVGTVGGKPPDRARVAPDVVAEGPAAYMFAV